MNCDDNKNEVIKARKTRSASVKITRSWGTTFYLFIYDFYLLYYLLYILFIITIYFKKFIKIIKVLFISLRDRESTSREWGRARGRETSRFPAEKGA